jgi:hypothetical protein
MHESRETYRELAEQCRWEAERTLDREAAQALRALADRYKLMSERQTSVPRQGATCPSGPT